MLPPKILLISCFTTVVYAQHYDLTSETIQTSVNEKDSQSTGEPFHEFINTFDKYATNHIYKDTTYPPTQVGDTRKHLLPEAEQQFTKLIQNISPPTSSPQPKPQDTFTDTTEFLPKIPVEVTSAKYIDDIPSTGTIPVTKVYTIDYPVSEGRSFPLGDTELRTKTDRISTTTTTTMAPPSSQSTFKPLVTIVTSTQTPTKSTPTPRLKMGKTIKTYKSSADQVLRQFVENGYLRQPLACIIDTTDSNLRKAQMLWNATLRSNAPLDILLSGYNSTGVGGIFSFKNTRTLLTGLSNMRESVQTTESGKALTAVLKASELIPYDSAIFLSTDNDPTDYEQFDRAATVLIKKRIRLYLIWFGETTFEENETSERQGKTGGKLGELSLSTGGEILHITNDALDKNGDLGLITLFARTGIQETLDYELGNSVQDTATVQPIYTTKTLSMSYQSTSTPDPKQEFIVNDYDTVTLLNWDGNFNSHLKSEQLTVDEVSNELNVSKNLGTASEQVDLVFGENVSLDTSNRLSRQNNEMITLIQPNLNSQLLVNPGSTVRVVFDVTNMREQTVFHNFQVTGEKSWLLNFGPRGAWIGPKQTIQVTVLAQVPQNAEVGLTDKVTLISNSLTVTSQAVYVRVITGGALQDPHRPYLHYTYGARCDGKTEAGTCSNGFWSLEITTQDHQTGILRIESEPIGLVIRTPYVAGTKEDVRATYTSSCCQPRVTVTSYDVAKNPSTFTVDVRDVWLSSAGIAAVTLGVLLGVLLIVFIIAALVWCCCRNRESRDLPVYRTDSRTSRRT